MSTTLSIYAVTCLTEAARFATDYRSTIPTTCPNNNTHTIDPLQTQIVSTINNKVVTVDQSSSVVTGNHFRCDPFTFTANPGLNNFDIVYPYNVSLSSTTFRLVSDNIGDTIRVISRPDTVVGLTLSLVSVGETTLTISPLAVAQLNVGFLLKITDGINTQELGEITAKDNTTGILTFSVPTSNNFTIGSIVMITIEAMRTILINKFDDLKIGMGKIKPVGQIANKITRIIYNNNGMSTKNLSLLAQIYY